MNTCYVFYRSYYNIKHLLFSILFVTYGIIFHIKDKDIFSMIVLIITIICFILIVIFKLIPYLKITNNEIVFNYVYKIPIKQIISINVVKRKISIKYYLDGKEKNKNLFLFFFSQSDKDKLVNIFKKIK